MARIRTIKPEMARHRVLYLLEKESGLPIRFSWAMLLTTADREGRFKWRAEELKLDCLPYDDIDFEAVLNVLLGASMLVKYRVGKDWYGAIPTWSAHQAINHREAASRIPAPDAAEETQHGMSPVPGSSRARPGGRERKGKEGKGTGREGEQEQEGKEGTTPPAGGSPVAVVRDRYSAAYQRVYGTPPVINGKTMGQLANLVKRLPANEAPEVAEFYLTHKRAIYVASKHSVDLLLRDCEGLRTEWVTGRKVTDTEARQGERTQANASAFQDLLRA